MNQALRTRAEKAATQNGDQPDVAHQCGS
jgi:hypothetical protein